MKQVSWVIIPVISGLCIAGLYFIVTEPYGPVALWNRKVVRPETVVTMERRYVCGELELVSEGPAPSALIGLDSAGLQKRFPEKAGWSLAFRLPTTVRITRKVADFCPEHRSFRHIGIKDGYVAVFQGPLGFDHRPLRCEKHLPVAALTPGLCAKLLQAMSYQEQLPALQAQLRQELEFTDEAELNAALENLDELQE
ncbi:MAG: hypothetical protein AB1426_05225 [Bacillota bacterium]